MIEEQIVYAAKVIAAVGSIGGVGVWVIKTVRHFGEGIKCMLRSMMLSIYYKHNDEDTIRQWEAENFELMYHAYKALGGNSFIDNIHEEVKKWEVTR